ncbi:uncharacterized protein [Amphiura filiformis]|uniref:uncharacterized protein n=1 Tax=Amphiura filiformis TaxID=82378 RepID=UPI003B220B6D
MWLSVTFLLAASCSSIVWTQPQDATQTTNSCHLCCQGASGLPGIPGAAGIPGSSGHNGLPGRDGMKGEKGELGVSVKGDKGDIGLGQIGLPGGEGPKGERGTAGLQGVPGKTGPRGIIGDPGANGQPGLVGRKGDKGESGRSRKSAFTAIKTGSQSGNIGDVVTFQETPTNLNSDFSLETNKFTCQVAGTYVFMFAIGVHYSTDPVIWLAKNGNRVLSGHARTGGNSDYDHTANSAILNLATGDQVWLQFAWANGRTIHSNSHKMTSFSGFLLYELD